MLGDLSGVSKIFVITGRTDMRKSFDGLMAIVRDSYDLDPYSNALFLFCGRDFRKIKALHFDKDGFVLMQKRLDGSGRFQWPRNASEARQLTRQEFRWLMEGLAIDQPKAIKAGSRKKDFWCLYKTEKNKNFFPVIKRLIPGLSTAFFLFLLHLWNTGRIPPVFLFHGGYLTWKSGIIHWITGSQVRYPQDFIGQNDHA